MSTARPQRRFWKIQANYFRPVDGEPERRTYEAREALVLPLDTTRAKALDQAANEYAAVTFAERHYSGLAVSITARNEHSTAWVEVGQFRPPSTGGTPVAFWNAAA